VPGTRKYKVDAPRRRNEQRARRPAARAREERSERDKTAKLVHVLDAPRLAPVLSRAPGRALPGTGRAVVRVEIKPGTNMHR